MSYSTIDLSKMTPDAVKSQVRGSLFKSRGTTLPLIIAAILTVIWLIGQSPWIFTIIVGAVPALVGVAYFCYNYFMKFDTHRNKYFSQLREENEREARQELLSIEQFLEKREFMQGADQVVKLQNKMAGFVKVLNKRFDEGEMAYSRYHQGAEKVYETAIDNLQNVIVHIEAIENIDVNYIQGRWEELEAICEEHDGLDDAQMKESEALKERFEILGNHELIIEGLLGQNERAMTELDKFSSKLATAKTDGRDVEEELQRLMDNLGKLSDEAVKNWG